MKNLRLLIVVLLLTSAINFSQAQTSTEKLSAEKPSLIPVYYADGKPVANAHIVIGQISIPAGNSQTPYIVEFPVTLSNEAAFTSANSYRCFASKPFGAGLLTGGLFRIIDESHFAFRTGAFGPAWQQDFFCIGN